MTDPQVSSAPLREGEGAITDAERRYLEALRSVEEMQRALSEEGRASLWHSPPSEQPRPPPATPKPRPARPRPQAEAVTARPDKARPDKARPDKAPKRPGASPRAAAASRAAKASRAPRAPGLPRVGIAIILVALVAAAVASVAWWRTAAPEDAPSGDRAAEAADVAPPPQRAAEEELAGSPSDAVALEPASSETDPSAGDTSGVRMRRHVNESGGYSFSYPAGWELQHDRDVAKVRSPGGHLVVSFALGPVGLPHSYDGFAALLESSFGGVRIASIESASVEGRKSVDVRGIAGEDGRVSFRALLVEREDQRSVGAFAATDTGTFDPRLHSVLTSLRL